MQDIFSGGIMYPFWESYSMEQNFCIILLTYFQIFSNIVIYIFRIILGQPILIKQMNTDRS